MDVLVALVLAFGLSLLLASLLGVVVAAAAAATHASSIAARPHHRGGGRLGVVLGCGMGGGLLVAAALLLAFAATPVPVGLVAYAGLFPLLRGARRLLSLSSPSRLLPPFHTAEVDSGWGADVGALPAHSAWRVAATAVIKNGGDAFVVCLALFATHTALETAFLAGGIVSATVASASVTAAHARPALVALVRVSQQRFAPWALVAVGAYVLVQGGALNWLLLGR